jgi:tagatose 6-phosphate kinase
MIVAVCLNPALDVTYHVDALVPGRAHRVRSARERAGGKGSNVAHVLAQLGEKVSLHGFAGGSRGARLRSALAGTGVEDRLTHVDGETRQSVAVVDAEDVTVLNEPGPAVTSHEWEALVDAYTSALSGARVVVLAGSVPPGVPGDAYAHLVRLARRGDLPTVLDTGGAQLLAALAERPTVAAPNHHEVAEALGTPLRGADEALVAAEDLSSRSGGTAVVSVGRAGLVAATPRHRWRVAPPRVLDGNPTGAGDALTAALARGVADGRCLPEVLADAVALSGAAVVRPAAGEVDPATYDELRALCRVEEVR